MNMNTRKALHYFCGTLVGIAIANFIVFVIVAAYLGGDAFNGKQIGEHFYLGWKGAYTEVSRNVFGYSQVHVFILIMNYACAIPAAYVLYRLKRHQNA